ncbi:MAG: LPS export ABC transporter periplasmic protein LptC [Alphaproteobacteria bacterium]|nr:LPS export ABC transporter periplasmic protein LptC [Alphaproteobacteria bacterium]
MTDLAHRHGGGHPGGLSFDSEGGDRSRDFDKARRHTKHVRILRLVLPVVTIIITGLYVASVLKTSGIGSGLAQIALPRILPTDLSMHNPHYEGYSEDGSMYKVAAATASPNLKNTNIITLNDITAELIDAQKQKTNLTATRGVFDSKASILELYDAIDIVGQNGLKAKLTQATVNSKTNVITSDNPVVVEFPAGSVQSQKLTIKQKQKHVTFSNNVKANLKPPPKPAAEQAKKSNTQMFVGSNKPIAITSESLEIFDADKRAVFSGNVVARQGLASLTSPVLEASYDTGAGTSSVTNSKDTEAAKPRTLISGSGGKLRRIIAKGPVVMTQGPTDRVTCQTADFDALNETAVLTGQVVMTSGPGRSARSDRVDLDQARQRAVLTGNVIVTQDKNTLKGRRLEVDQLNQQTRLSSPAGVGFGSGRISARFIQTGSGKRKTSTSSKSGRGGETGAFRADPNAPLDILADRLLVEDRIKTAIFSGAVQAKQGAFKIEAAELRALYSGSAALGSVSSRSAAGSSSGATTLKQIKAKKNVVITGSDGQRVKGDWADFDVEKSQATVGGNVELRQAGNVVHGTRLTINTTTGRSVIETAPKNTVAKPQGGGWVTSGGSKTGNNAAAGNQGRPSAVFYFNDIDKARSKVKSRKPSASSAWEAQTGQQ